MRNLRLLLPYIGRYRVSYIVGMFIILGRSMIDLFQPYLLRVGIDSLNTTTNGGVRGDLGFLTFIALTIIAIGLVQFGLGFWQRQAVNRNSHQIEYDIRRDVYKKIQKLDRTFFDEMSMGELMVRSTVDISVQRNFLGTLFVSGPQVLFTGVFALVLMFLQNWRLALVALLLLPFITVSFAIIGSRTQRYFKAGQEQLSELSDRAQEVFVGIRVVKAYNREAAEIERYSRENNAFLKMSLKFTRLEGLLMPIVTLTLSITTGILLWVGGNEIAAGRLTIGQFVQFNAYLLTLSNPLANLGQLLNLAQRASASMGRLNEIFLRQPKIQDGTTEDRGQGLEDGDNQVVSQANSVLSPRPSVLNTPTPNPQSPTPNQGRIDFVDVTLRHGDQTVLDNVNLTFEAGKTVAVVGPTGSGKSSLAALLGRVYDPQEGQVLLDGVDVRQMPLQELRERIVYVPQETLLFSLSLRGNIAFARETAPDDAVLRAAELSRLAQDLPQIPGGLDAFIGERGVTLSGGQKQRTAIARALLPEANVLILDDALSSVDARTQNMIAANLKQTSRGRTTLIVTQRLSLVKDADWIVVVNNGKVVEQGNHAALMANRGLYARMLEREVALAVDTFLDEDVPVSVGAGAADSGTPVSKPTATKESKAKAKAEDDDEEITLSWRARRKKRKQQEREEELDEIVGKDYKGGQLVRLAKYVGKYWRLAALTLPIILLASLLELVGPYLSKEAIDNHIVPRQLEGLSGVIILFLIASVAAFVMRYLRTFLMQMLGQRVVRDLRTDLFSHLLKHSLGFFDRYPAGSLMSRLTSDMDAITDFLSQGLVAIVADFITLVAIIVAMLLLDWRLALVSMAIMPILGGSAFYFRTIMKRVYRLSRSRYSKLNGFVAESYAGMLMVQLFNRQAANYQQFKELNQKYFLANRQIIFFNGIFLPLVAFLGIFSNACLLWFGGWDLVSQGDITFGLLVAFLQYTDRAFTPIRNIAERYTIFQAASTSTERIFSLLDQQPSIVDPANPRPLVEAGRKNWASVQFDKVTFGYKPEFPIMREMSFEVKAGEKVAIVGATGAGKTSIVSLLGHNYEIQGGAIRIGGTDIRDTAQHDLRQHLALVLQDPVLFKGTIAENIKLGNENLSDEAMRLAAQQVGADSFIERLPDGYDYQLRERGSNLSAGQRQLISFARAIAYNPDAILILDEATSSIDTESEAIIQDALKKLLEKRTAIIIAHRLSTIRDVDRVIVVERGRVVEDGTQAELLAQRGLFYQLYSNQQAAVRLS